MTLGRLFVRVGFGCCAGRHTLIEEGIEVGATDTNRATGGATKS
jgi:hypothetical protein